MKRALSGSAVALLLMLAACTGGDDGPTRAEFVHRANAVCRDGATRISLLRIPGRADVASMPQAAAGVVTVQRKALARLRAIEVPKQDRSQVARWIALVDQTIDQAELSAEAQREGDITRAAIANVNGAALDRRADRLARNYGLDVCVQAATPPPTASTSTTSSTRPGT